MTAPGISPPAAGPQPTRLAPLTAMTGASPLESPSLQQRVSDEPAGEELVAPKSKLPLVLAALVGVLAVAVIALFAFGDNPRSSTRRSTRW